MEEATTHPPLVFLPQREVARMLHVSERTLEKWRVVGSGPPFARIGRRCLYRPQDVCAWANSKLRVSTRDARPEGELP